MSNHRAAWSLLAALTCLANGVAGESVSWTVALKEAGLHVEWQSAGSDSITGAVRYGGASPATLHVPAGALFANGGGVRLVTLRQVTIPVTADADVTIPAAALRLVAPPPQPGAFLPTGETLGALTPLLTAFATLPDIPRLTAQLAISAVTENPTFAQWVAHLRSLRPEAEAALCPTPADIVQAVDALGLLSAAGLAGKTALGQDAELKARSLRNPWARAKAMSLFGLALPGDLSVSGGAPPDLGQLLHTKAGDNCPVCKTRDRMQRGSDL